MTKSAYKHPSPKKCSFPAPVNNLRIKDVQYCILGSSVWDGDMGGQLKKKVYKAEGGSFVVTTNLIRAMED